MIVDLVGYNCRDELNDPFSHCFSTCVDVTAFPLRGELYDQFLYWPWSVETSNLSAAGGLR